jgi:Fe-S cluster assembly protein SufD
MSALAAQTPSATLDRYRALFDARYAGQDAFTVLRRRSLENFLAAGFPTQRDDNWKYTNLRRLESRNFAPAESAPVAPDESQWIADAGARIVLVNGHWMPSLSSASPQPPGVTVLTLGRWIANQPADAAAFLEKIDAGQPLSAFEHLNGAFVEDGVVIDIADGAALDQPVYVIHQWSPGATLQMQHPRIVVRAGRNSSVTLVEHYLGQGDQETFTNARVAIELGAGARLHHYRLQQESVRGFHVGNTRARLDRDSRYCSYDVALGGSIARVNITAWLQGPGAEASLRGLFAPDGTQHIDTQTRVEHVAAHTISNEEYRGIADGRGRGIFNGKVIVHAGAQKIDSRQSSRNLLLSATAEIDTKPELEIYANDVKCSHGATTGQLDANSLFYLRSRGISAVDARALLIRAFAESILTSFDYAPVRNYLERRLHARFAGIADLDAQISKGVLS